MKRLRRISATEATDFNVAYSKMNDVNKLIRQYLGKFEVVDVREIKGSIEILIYSDTYHCMAKYTYLIDGHTYMQLIRLDNPIMVESLHGLQQILLSMQTELEMLGDIR